MRGLILGLLEEYVAGQAAPPGVAPMPAKVGPSMVLKFTCSKCNQVMAVECEHTHGLAAMHFVAINCPRCGNPSERSLPGELLSVPRAGAV